METRKNGPGTENGQENEKWKENVKRKFQTTKRQPEATERNTPTKIDFYVQYTTHKKNKK
jgi:hypothetical protein